MNISYKDIPYIEGNICPECGGYKTASATLCVKCCARYTQKKRPSREELKFLIRYMPFTKIGAKYDVSDGTVKVWCKQYKLPHLKRDINKITDEEWSRI